MLRHTADQRGPSFCVVGAGIIGLSSAYCLAKHFRGCRVTVIYDESSPDTASNHSFGLCSIRGLDETSGRHTPRWAKATGKYCEETIRNDPDLAKTMGLNAETAHLIFDKKQYSKETCPVWDTFSFSKKLNAEETDALGINAEGLGEVLERKNASRADLMVFKAGTWIIDCDLYLPWLKSEMELMLARGQISHLQFQRKRIYHFDEVFRDDYDFIVNCSGMGSEYLVPDDKVFPIRGQYIVTKTAENIGLRYGYHTFICPKPGRVILGTVYQQGRRDNASDIQDERDIFRRCLTLNPSVANCRIVKHDVGVRPARIGGPRVELEMRFTSTRGKHVPMIHNYGHGPRGIMQHWGCALDVVKLADELLKQKSKL